MMYLIMNDCQTKSYPNDFDCLKGVENKILKQKMTELHNAIW